jgi:hypothetical protein
MDAAAYSGQWPHYSCKLLDEKIVKKKMAQADIKVQTPYENISQKV